MLHISLDPVTGGSTFSETPSGPSNDPFVPAPGVPLSEAPPELRAKVLTGSADWAADLLSTANTKVDPSRF